MQKIIKFRGMTLNGEWVYGYVSVVPDKLQDIKPGCYISNKAGSPFAYQVRPETVGQYTGLKNRDGVEIYEGDIIRYEGMNDARFHNVEVRWDDNEACFKGGTNPLWEISFECQVIGNIYENPGLLKGSS